MAYKLIDWDLSNTTYVTPKPGDLPDGQEYVIFDIPDLSAFPYTNITKQSSSSTIGNSIEIVADFNDNNTSTKLYMFVDDGDHREGFYIHKNNISILNSDVVIPIDNTPGTLHKYTLTLDNNKFTVYFDKSIVYQTEPTNASVSPTLFIGFPDSQTGSAIVKFKYIKSTPGIYKYVILPEVDFELQIDSSEDFNTVNLKTYTKKDFENVSPVGNPWEPVLFMCGNFVNNAYDGNGIVQSATVRLPEKPDATSPTFYYRVRVKSGNVYSDYSYTWLDKRVRPKQLSTIPVTVSLLANSVGNSINSSEFLINADENKYPEIKDRNVEEIYTQEDSGYHAIVPSVDHAGIVLPETPLPDDWSIQLYNASDKTIDVYDAVGNTLLSIGPWQVVQYTYDTATNLWSNMVVRYRNSFSLLPNITSTVFNTVFNKVIPADRDTVYTKALNSGNTASIVHAEAASISDYFYELKQLSDNISIFQADRDIFNNKWSIIFGLDKSLFKNPVDMRDILQQLALSVNNQMKVAMIKDVIAAITGSVPDIIEYKDILFNVLWSSAEQKELPLSERYYIYDPEHPNFSMNPFVLYSDALKKFTWQINIYDTYGIKYSQEMVTQIIDLIKPAWSYAVIHFYNEDGALYDTRYYYGSSDYLRAYYNK